MLYAREVPQTGGDTLFASMYAAYEALSDGLKATLEGLRACHSSRHVFGIEAMARRGDLNGRIGNPELATQDAVHPVVIRHPETGRKALYVNPGFTLRFEGWTDEESRPLLEYLYRHAVRPEFTCRFRWGEGSLALGITARPGISRSTTITASVACCTASRSRARRCTER